MVFRARLATRGDRVQALRLCDKRWRTRPCREGGRAGWTSQSKSKSWFAAPADRRRSGRARSAGRCRTRMLGTLRSGQRRGDPPLRAADDRAAITRNTPLLLHGIMQRIPRGSACSVVGSTPSSPVFTPMCSPAGVPVGPSGVGPVIAVKPTAGGELVDEVIGQREDRATALDLEGELGRQRGLAV